VAVPALKVANPAFNAAKTLELMKEAASKHAVLVVFPELGLTSYTCDDLFHQNTILEAALEALDRIREASKNIPKEIKAKYNDIPWTEMARMRDKITHFYFGIDYKVVWSVVKKELPVIEPAITKLLGDLKAFKSTKKK